MGLGVSSSGSRGQGLHGTLSFRMQSPYFESFGFGRVRVLLRQQQAQLKASDNLGVRIYTQKISFKS